MRTATEWTKQYRRGETHPDADKPMRSEPFSGFWKREFVDAFIADYLKANAFTIKAQPDPAVEAKLELSVDPMTPAELYACFTAWRKENSWLVPPEEQDTAISDSTLAKRWAFRLRQEGEEGVPKLRYRSMRGEDNGCKTCCLLYLRHKQAKGKVDKAYWRRQRQLHRDYYIGERKFNEEWVNEAYADLLNFLSLITDGFDTFKSTLPIISEAPGGDLSKMRKNFYVLKLQGTIIHGHLFMHTIYHPWVRGGANALCTAVHQALRLRWIYTMEGPTLVPRPGKTCRITVDGGPENWNNATWCYFAWLVLIFPDGVYVHRMPTKHTEASIDRNFQAGSVLFYGCRGRTRGLMCCTLQEFFELYKQAYAGRVTSKFGGEVELQEVQVVWNWWAYFAPYMHKHFKGLGHAKKQWVNQHGFIEEGNKGSMVHFLHFFRGSDDHIYLRYKTRARADHWLPDGADGVKNHGRRPFNVPASQLPTWQPGFAPFCPKWEGKLPKVKKAVLSINEKCGEEYQTLKQREAWEEHFNNIPRTAADVVPEMRPIWWFPPAPAASAASAGGATTVSILGASMGARHGRDMGVSWV